MLFHRYQFRASYSPEEKQAHFQYAHQVSVNHWKSLNPAHEEKQACFEYGRNEQGLRVEWDQELFLLMNLIQIYEPI